MSKGRPAKSPFEIGVLMMSLLAIGIVIFGLVLLERRAGNDGADLRASVKTLEQPGSYEVVVRNVGNKTAERVVVEVTAGEESVETEFQLVAKGHEERAKVRLRSEETPKARVVSFHEV